jgi:pSer/pThr/pTyr-binding forkhead associated (FHA) protein
VLPIKRETALSDAFSVSNASDESVRARGAVLPESASVRVEKGFYEGLEVPIDRSWLVIGRGRGADLVIADPTISRSHAAVGWDSDEGFFVQDLGSTNGTRVNGDRLARGPLGDGDALQLGKLELRFRCAGRGGALGGGL